MDYIDKSVSDEEFFTKCKERVLKEYGEYPINIEFRGPFLMECEWDDNRTRCVSADFSKKSPDLPDFIDGVCLSGMCHIFEDEDWGTQAEWFSCYKDDCGEKRL